MGDLLTFPGCRAENDEFLLNADLAKQRFLNVVSRGDISFVLNQRFLVLDPKVRNINVGTNFLSPTQLKSFFGALIRLVMVDKPELCNELIASVRSDTRVPFDYFFLNAPFISAHGSLKDWWEQVHSKLNSRGIVFIRDFFVRSRIFSLFGGYPDYYSVLGDMRDDRNYPYEDSFIKTVSVGDTEVLDSKIIKPLRFEYMLDGEKTSVRERLYTVDRYSYNR